MSLAAVALAGCGPGGPSSLEGFGDGDGDNETVGDGDGDGDDPVGDGDGDGECVIEAVAPSESVFFLEENLSSDHGHHFADYCLEGSIGDYAVSWSAPYSGPFRAMLYSDFDGALTVLRGTCQGTFVGCDSFGLPSFVDFQAIEDLVYTFVIDGYFGGWFWLEVVPWDDTPGDCPDGELWGLQQTIFGSTNGGGSNFASSCGGFESPDRSYLFLPEVDGVYRIDTFGSSFDTILHVFGGACAAAPELACNDDGGVLTESRVEVWLNAGQVYTIVVDGFAGSQGEFQLNLQLLDEQSVCDELVVIPPGLPKILSWPTFESSSNAFHGCSFASFERRFTWVAPADGSYRLTQTAGLNNFSAVAVLLDGCAGNLEACAGSDMNNQVELVFDAKAGQDVVIISEWEPIDLTNITLTLEVFEPGGGGCGEDLGSEVPLVFAGTTFGFGDDHQGSCSINPAPERELHWTAPSSGTYRFTLEGSSYDTLMYIRDGGCDGVELGCSDDTLTEFGLELWSTLELDLTAGQTVSIFVDGYSSGGDFELTITEL